MAAVPAVAPIVWAASNDGWPIYAARDAATGLQERLQENAAGQVVDAAGVVYALNADGYPEDAAGADIPQASQAIRIRDLALGYLHLLPHLPPVIPPPVVPPPPVPPGPPVAAVFALNPGQVAVHTVIDYTTSEGQRIFRESTKPLFAESNKFALSADRIQSFLQTLKARGSVNGWNFNVNVGDAIAPSYKSLVDHFGEIPLSKIRDTVENEIQGQAIRRRQTDNMMHECILSSLTEAAAAIIYLKVKDYKAPNGEDSGLLLLKLVISESTLETKSTVNNLWGKLTTGLPDLMAGHSNNVQLFNRDVKALQENLRARGQNPDNIIPQLFSTYYNCEGTNSPLGRYIEYLENAFNNGMDLNSNELMFKVEEKYKELKERHQIHGQKKDEELVALKAQLEEYKKNPKRGGGNSESDDKKKKLKWMFVKPKDGEAKSKTINEKEYHWCDGKEDAHKPKWVRHHPKDCGKRDGQAGPVVPPVVAPAPPSTTTPPATTPSWTTVMLSTLADQE
jgi:hypothetical protein